MVEQRRNPRIWVSWRCGIRLPDGRLLLCRAQNISIEGLALISDEVLHKGRSYPMMIEIPGINDLRTIHRVSCTGEVRHVILSEGAYRAGIQLTEVHEAVSRDLARWKAA